MKLKVGDKVVASKHLMEVFYNGKDCPLGQLPQDTVAIVKELHCSGFDTFIVEWKVGKIYKTNMYSRDMLIPLSLTINDCIDELIELKNLIK